MNLRRIVIIRVLGMYFPLLSKSNRRRRKTKCSSFRLLTKDGCRAGYATLSLKNPSEKMIKTINEMFLEEFGPLRGITGVVLSLPLMFISKDEVLHMTKNGGNPLGLKVEDCPLLRKSFHSIPFLIVSFISFILPYDPINYI